MNATNRHRNDSLIGRTRAVWEPRVGRRLTHDEAEQIATNVAGLFSVLAEWSRAEPSPSARDDAIGSLSDTKAERHER